jgi:hypothetical protein
MEHSGWKYNKVEHWFYKECMSKKKTARIPLVEYKVKDDDISRVKYWECRKEYDNILERKKAAWQESNESFK